MSRDIASRYRVDPSGCWLWTGPLMRSGYGTMWFYRLDKPGRTQTSTTAHRFVYERLVGPIPKGLHLDHLCRNRGCVNPAHLEPVTPSENNKRARSVAR